MDIDKLIPLQRAMGHEIGFGSLMDIDKLIPFSKGAVHLNSFGSLMDIDKLIRRGAVGLEPGQFWFSDGY